MQSLHVGREGSTGRLAFNFAALRKSELHLAFSTGLMKNLGHAGLRFPQGAEKRYPEFPIEEWGTKAEDIAAEIERTLSSVTSKGV